MLPLTVESFENNEILYLDISSTTTPNNMLKYALINESEDSPVNELKPGMVRQTKEKLKSKLIYCIANYLLRKRLSSAYAL